MSQKTRKETHAAITSDSHNLVHVPGVGVLAFPKTAPMEKQNSWAGKAYELGQRKRNRAK